MGGGEVMLFDTCERKEHTKKKNKQTNKNREIVSCPITAR